MDIRGLTEQEIRDALERANQKYNGNIRLREQHYDVPNPDYDPTTYRFDFSIPIERRYPTTYKYADLRPLNKRGDRYSARLTVLTTRAPGSRVSVERWGVYGPVGNKQKRIASACWHAHRTVLEEIFATNSDAVVVTALATYKGEEDFRDKFPDTYHGVGMAGPAPIQDLGGSCNCDEGDYPEFATERLSQEQYEYRKHIWPDHPVPGSKAALKHPERAIRREKEKV